MPEHQKPLADVISRLRAFSGVLFLTDRDLHFKLVDLVFEKENLLSFSVSVLGCQSFGASFAGPPGESGGQQSGPNERGNGRIKDVEVLCHRTCSHGL